MQDAAIGIVLEEVVALFAVRAARATLSQPAKRLPYAPYTRTIYSRYSTP